MGQGVISTFWSFLISDFRVALRPVWRRQSGAWVVLDTTWE